MEELTIEQKAKAYDEAKARMRRAWNDNRCTLGFMNEIFPELRESEDERIRKALINGFNKLDKSAVWYNGITNGQILAWLEKQGNNMGISEATKRKLEDSLNKALEKETSESCNEFLDEQGEQKPAIEMKSAEESLGIDSETYNKIVDECIYGEQKPAEWHREDEQNLNACLGYIPDEYLRRWLTDVVHVKYDKPTDKAEPKFHEGDWVVWDNKITCHIDNIYQGKESLMYTITDAHNMIRSYSVKGFDNNAHLWSIQDAKDGDVLADGDIAILLFRGVGNNEWSDAIDYYALLETNMNNRFSLQEGDAYWGKVDNCSLCPATKEQRNNLIKAMADAGYTFDFEKKELKKIEQKPAWSEEDEYCRNQLIVFCENCMQQDSSAIKCANWLKSLKDRVQPKQEWKQENTGDLTDFENAMMHIDDSFFGQHAGLDPNDTSVVKEQAKLLLELVPKQEWGEEDENIYHSIIDILTKQGFQTQVNWLKSLKERVQPQQEWSKKDENNILFLTSIIEECFKDKEKITLYGDTVCANFTKKDVIDRLKSLRPQSHWKPSEEQLKSLQGVIAAGYFTSYPNSLETLYEQLKKLRGE